MIPTNEYRADAAYCVLSQYNDPNENDLETTATDLITDIFHLANREGWDIEAMVAMARMHFQAED
jgi:hypothetical protein